ncbi:MAG: TolC family protein [Fulvivirga sp.]
MRQLLTILILLPYLGWSQVSDSASVAFDTYYQWVIQHHPVAKQVALLSESAAAEVRLARGGFDPKVVLDWEKKSFDNKTYYDKIGADLKIPTWLGITPEVGFSQRQGEFLNPENYISDATENQQVSAGVTVSLGRGLFIDDRRAALQQAQLFSDMAEAQQVFLLNELLLEAAMVYWEWYTAHYQFEVVNESILLSQDIFDRTKMAFEYGEVAAIDTVQAKTNLLTRQAEQIEALTKLQKAKLKLSTFLWDAEGNPLELNTGVVPEQVVVTLPEDEALSGLLQRAERNHPSLQKLRIEASSLEVNRRLATEQLKPKLDLKYRMLDQPLDPEGEFVNPSFNENYQLGLGFEIPIFLRKERAKVQQVNIKLQENKLKQDLSTLKILNEIRASYTELINTAALISQQSAMVQNYQLLVDAERLNLANGESDLFKLNGQLDKLLNSQYKLVKENARYKKLLAQLYWAAGVENLGFN